MHLVQTFCSTNLSCCNKMLNIERRKKLNFFLHNRSKGAKTGPTPRGTNAPVPKNGIPCEKNRFSGRNPDFLGLKKRVRLAIMLVMMTIFTSKIEELPPTSDMKMIDAWLIFCLIVPFLEVILRTAIECMNCSCHICEQKEDEKKEEVWAVEASTVKEEVKEENLEVAGGKCWRRNWQSALCVTGEIAFQGRSCLQLSK